MQDKYKQNFNLLFYFEAFQQHVLQLLTNFTENLIQNKIELIHQKKNYYVLKIEKFCMYFETAFKLLFIESVWSNLQRIIAIRSIDLLHLAQSM